MLFRSDRLIGNSSALTDLKNTFFNGDPEHFKSQLRQWVADFGVKSEDLKNLTVAALLGRMLSSSSGGPVLNAIQAGLDWVKTKGLADVNAASILSADLKKA